MNKIINNNLLYYLFYLTMEFVTFNVKKKEDNDNKYYYYTNNITNGEKYLLITIEDTNINFVRLIVNNEIRYINGNISRNCIEIKPCEEYHFDIFDKNDIYINKLDFKESYVLIKYTITNLPFYINSKMKILFFECMNFNIYDEYFEFNISTDNFILNNNKILNIQNININIINSLRENIIKLFNNDKSIEQTFNREVKFISSEEIFLYYKYYDEKISKFFNLKFLSLITKFKTILISKYDNINNFKYHNNDENNIKYKFYITNCNNDISIKIPFSIIPKMLLYDSTKSEIKQCNNKEKYEHIKNKIQQSCNKNNNYIVIDIENNASDYEDYEQNKISNLNSSMKSKEMENKKYIEKIIEFLKNNNKKYIDEINKNINNDIDMLATKYNMLIDKLDDKINNQEIKYKEYSTIFNENTKYDIQTLYNRQYEFERKFNNQKNKTDEYINEINNNELKNKEYIDELNKKLKYAIKILSNKQYEIYEKIDNDTNDTMKYINKLNETNVNNCVDKITNIKYTLQVFIDKQNDIEKQLQDLNCKNEKHIEKVIKQNLIHRFQKLYNNQYEIYNKLNSKIYDIKEYINKLNDNIKHDIKTLYNVQNKNDKKCDNETISSENSENVLITELNTYPKHISSNSRILFFDIVNFFIDDEYINISIETNEILINNNYFIHKYKFVNNIIINILMDLLELCDGMDIYKIFADVLNLNYLSLAIQSQIILNINKDNIYNFKYCNEHNTIFPNIHKFYLTNNNNNDKMIKIPIIGTRWGIAKSNLFGIKNGINIFEIFKNRLLTEYKQTSYIIMSIDKIN